MLAAYDIAARLPTLIVRCYTYGAPRTGNRAFAEDYGRVVEDTWHIINGAPSAATAMLSCATGMATECLDDGVLSAVMHLPFCGNSVCVVRSYRPRCGGQGSQVWRLQAVGPRLALPCSQL